MRTPVKLMVRGAFVSKLRILKARTPPSILWFHALPMQNKGKYFMP